MALRDYILAKTTPTKFNDFIHQFLQENRFHEKTLDYFMSRLKTSTGVDISDHIRQWYNNIGLPGYHIMNESYSIMQDPEGKDSYIYGFHIMNCGTLDGSIKVFLAKDYFGWNNFPEEHNFIIKAGTASEIKIATDKKISNYYIQTGISQNTPDIHHIKVPALATFSGNQKSGIFPIDTSHFKMSSTDEIIVDNEDKGFRLISAVKEKKMTQLLQHWFNRQDEFESTRNWKIDYSMDSYGDITKSAYHKLAEDGKSKAEWKTDIRIPGKYTVYFYNKTFNFHKDKKNLLGNQKNEPITLSTKNPAMQHSTHRPNSKNYYTIFKGNSAEEIIVDMNTISPGWVELGTFEFPAGPTKVVLDDRGSVPDQIICADAIKWVRKH